MSNLKQKQEMCNSQWMLIQYLLAQWWHIVVSKFSSLLTCWCLELFFTFWENLFSSSYCTYQQEVLENLTFVNSTNFLSLNDFAFASDLWFYLYYLYIWNLNVFTHTFFRQNAKTELTLIFRLWILLPCTLFVFLRLQLYLPLSLPVAHPAGLQHRWKVINGTGEFVGWLHWDGHKCGEKQFIVYTKCTWPYFCFVSLKTH